MRIVYLQDDFEPYAQGGSAIAVSYIAKAVVKKGHEVYVITAVHQKAQAGSFFENGAHIERIYAAPYHERWRAYLSLYNPGPARAIKALFEKLRPEVVHAHNIHRYLSYYCLKIAKQSGAKVFLTAHDVMLFHYGKLIEFINPNDLSCPSTFNYKISPWQQVKRFKKRYNPLRNLIIRHYLKYVDKIFAVSNALKEALNQNGILNVEVVHNGIDADEWQIDASSSDRFREKYNLHGKKIILFGGRLSGAKGGRQAILALGEVVKKIPEAMLLVMGDENEYAKEMIKVAKEKGIDNHLIFTGWISGDELKAAYQASNLLIMPSLCFDTFGMVCLEAMASKKPVIAACFGGAREIVIDGQTGYIINPFNVIVLAKKIIDLLTNSSKAESFGRAGYERVKKEFGLDAVIDKTLKWYRD